MGIKIPIAKVGEWNGEPLTADFLRKVAENYDPKIHYAPLKATHREEGDVAYGWVESLEFEGDTLYAEIDITPRLVEAVKRGDYRNLSPEIYPDLDGRGPYLRAIALLGHEIPAIKALPPLRFSEDAFKGYKERRFKSFAKLDFPIAEPQTGWDADGAKKRIMEKFGRRGLAECCGAVEVEDDGELPDALSRYHFPFCDVIDGRRKIIPKAVSAGLAYLHGARGVKVRPELKEIVEPIFNKLAKKIEEVKKMDEKLKELEERVKKYEEQIKRYEEENKRLKWETRIKEFSEKLGLDEDKQQKLVKVFASLDDENGKLLEDVLKAIAEDVHKFKERVSRKLGVEYFSESDSSGDGFDPETIYGLKKEGNNG